MGNPDWSEGQEDAEIEANERRGQVDLVADGNWRRLQEAEARISVLEAENAKLKKRLEHKSHTSTSKRRRG